MTVVAKNNAFGAGSPSWNLSFPEGNLTASEIIAYLPHWLKSVDVILRFVNHGGRSVTITHLLNMFRLMPTNAFQPNSTTIMMHYAMRRAGKKDWTIGTCGDFIYDREYDENNLYVGDFRPPRLTHPKGASAKQNAKMEDLARNQAAHPIPFKDLALHVQRHPSGDDALDLARCVDYALKHPTEKWLFPTDFRKLVKRIGGPLPVTHSHLDRQLFARYDSLFTAHAPSRRSAKCKRNLKAGGKAKTNSYRHVNAGVDSNSETESDFGLKVSNRMVSQGIGAIEKVTCQARGSIVAGKISPILGKRDLGQVDGNHDDGSIKRRSNRRVKKPVYVDEDDDATDDGSFDDPREKRKLSRMPPTLEEEDSEFEVKEEHESSDDVQSVVDEIADDSDFGLLVDQPDKRLTSRKVHQTIREQYPVVLSEHLHAPTFIVEPTHKTFMDHSPGVMAAARAYGANAPAFLTPPTLSANRLIIDSYTVYLYAQDGCRNEDELWASALSTYRFGGPRQHAPFRELYRLTEPMVWDTSDWAENIRWAKDQYKHFGVQSWTEYDYHLECITSWRRQTLWVSEEAVNAWI